MTLRSSRGISRVLIPAALFASAALVLTGCSGGLGGGGEAGGDSSGPIKIGMLAPFSGSESAFGVYMENGAQMAVDELNADGGVDGRQLELITEDDACDATASVAAANKLVTAGIVASVGGYCSGATLPTLPIFNDAGIPMVIPAANSNKLVEAGLDGVFLINGTGTQQAAATLKYALKSGATRVAVLNDNTDYSKDLASTFVEMAKADGTIEVVLDQSVTPGEKDYSANVNNVITSKPDFVVWTGYYQEGALITRQLIDAGYSGPILVGDGSVDKKFAEIAGAGYTDNVVGTFTQTPDMLEGAGDWIAAYKEAFGAEPGPYSTQSYDAVRVVAEAIKNAGSTETDAIIAALRGLDGFPIFSGPLTFTPEGTLTEGGFAIVQIGPDGSFILKDDLQG
ncbi:MULTISPECIES: branched-chain amino acid ABC transporter substrate-binding protein [Microterricola]|uniref:Amino acid/amide ABC transporter substrate-binding protein, HAAT family n=2 Tax=Microterricola TaxID=518733 RepID=A0A1H1PPH1_9MICO|nr:MULTISPECIES: branched-chain amino acid ABC transporter substrate-binding protein [Microterricola]PPL19178.1 branched chain amino acid ABC transporter substrate-binding protein [Microterricola pindariensis]SDS13211.1 amino acid/amide ABC transporter substrate-binding protein, HAAT family [Microterricola viridarii]